MKKLLILIIAILAVGFGLYKAAAMNTSNSSVNFPNKKVLIAYYSFSGNTKAVAQKIQTLTGGDIFEIKTTTQYPKDYNTLTTLVQDEIKTGKLPKLQDNGNVSDYDIVFIGTPVWWGSASLPVKTFLVKNDFSGKTVIPFCTHGGGGQASTFADMQKLAPKAKFLKGFESNSNSADSTDIKKWILDLN